MAYGCKVLADSVSPILFPRLRLTTLEVTFPRIVLAEFNTHRLFSRNSASSRAIPVPRQLRRVMEDPFIPEQFGINQPGMQSEHFHSERHNEAAEIWLAGRNAAVVKVLELLLGSELLLEIRSWPSMIPSSEDIITFVSSFDYEVGVDVDGEKKIAKRNRLDDLTKGDSSWFPKVRADQPLNIHKQITNRLLEPFMWHTVIVTATEWSNFFALRVDENAQPEIFEAASLMFNAHRDSTPQRLSMDQWHLPLIQEDELHLLETPEGVERLKRVSAGRCARISYETHHGLRDLDADVKLHDSLIANGHMSPLEHVARPMNGGEVSRSLWSGNFRGWHQHRKEIPNEGDYGLIKAALER